MSQIEQLDDSFLDNEPVEVAETTEEVTESEVPETEPGEDNLSESEDSTTESTDESSEETETTEESTDKSESEKSWTFSQAMDEREKRQRFERENEELKKRLAEREEENDISVFDDETGARTQERRRTEELIRNNSLDMSQAFAEEVFGVEKVREVIDWMKTEGVKSAYVINQFDNAKLPFHEAVKMFDDEQARQNPDVFRAQIKAEVLKELKAESEKQSEKTEKQESIKPSLASKRSSGTEQTPVRDNFEDILGD